MYRDDCSDLVIEQVKKGLFIINLLYKVNEYSIDIIKQHICVTMIINSIGYELFSIGDYESNKFKDFANKIIENVHKHIKNSAEYYDEFVNNLENISEDKILQIINREYNDAVASILQNK